MKIIQVGTPLFQHMGKRYQVDSYQVSSFKEIESNIESREKLGYNICFWLEIQATDWGRSLNRNVLVYKCKFIKSETEMSEEFEKVEEMIL